MPLPRPLNAAGPTIHAESPVCRYFHSCLHLEPRYPHAPLVPPMSSHASHGGTGVWLSKFLDTSRLRLDHTRVVVEALVEGDAV